MGGVEVTKWGRVSWDGLDKLKWWRRGDSEDVWVL